MNHVCLARSFAFVVGLLDFGAGLGLTFLPAKILPIMRAPDPANDAIVYLRFVGVFAAAVGASYLSALLQGGVARLRYTLEFTILFRLATGIFSAVAVACGWLALGWVSVPAIDFAIIGIQLWFITKLPTQDVPSSSPSSF